jgi:hypothetical protein
VRPRESAKLRQVSRLPVRDMSVRQRCVGGA